MKLPGTPQSTGWLWRLGLLIFVAGGLVTYLIYQHGPQADQRADVGLSICITVLLGGMCLICASAHWWLKR